MGLITPAIRRVGLKRACFGMGLAKITITATLTDGSIVYRKGYRLGMYVIDKSEDGGLTWELNLVRIVASEDTIIINIDDGVTGYRHVIRDEAYCIDQELTPTGFLGTEDDDWENIFNTNTP